MNLSVEVKIFLKKYFCIMLSLGKFSPEITWLGGVSYTSRCLLLNYFNIKVYWGIPWLEKFPRDLHVKKLHVDIAFPCSLLTCSLYTSSSIGLHQIHVYSKSQVKWTNNHKNIVVFMNSESCVCVCVCVSARSSRIFFIPSNKR